MNPIIKYLQETRAELRHVAWPTHMQTAIYTVMVALLSVGVALYLGLFDYIFTTSLTRAISVLPTANPIDIEQVQTNPSDPSNPSQPSPKATAGTAGQAGTEPTAPLIQGSKLQIIPSSNSAPNPSTGSGQAN
ncbi:MAG: preprotein translocase subunit SecE [bacterium]|nr:preprotein translocase subunit SecE [bacterium]